MTNAKPTKTIEIRELLKPGMTVYLPGSSGEPTAVLQSLAQSPESNAGVHFITSFVPGINQFDLSSLGPEARFTAFFMHPSLRQAELDGRLDLLEMPYSRIAAWLMEQSLDIVVAQVAPQCRGGNFNLGPAVEFTPIALERAAVKVAVLNRQTPWLEGSVQLPADDFSIFVESDTALPGYADPGLTEVYRRIGAHVAELVPNGATLQVGLGQAPASALDALKGHRGLGLHSGVFSDSLLRLAEQGAFNQGPGLVSGVAVGSPDFYQLLGNYPGIRYACVSQTHSAPELRAINYLFTINSAIEVDLLGNLNAEFLGGRRISGRGGLPDFASAGHESNGGASIIVLPSTDSRGKHSRIVNRLETEPTVPAEWVDFVITEHGCARLRGRSPEQRAAAMRAVSSNV